MRICFIVGCLRASSYPLVERGFPELATPDKLKRGTRRYRTTNAGLDMLQANTITSPAKSQNLQSNTSMRNAGGGRHINEYR